MIDTTSHHRKKPITTTPSSSSRNLKLTCRFNGAFHIKPPFSSSSSSSIKTRYIGGETRIISVDRNTDYTMLRFRISQMCPNLPSFSLKYHLSGSGSHSNIKDYPLLVSVASDDDVLCMIDEYDKMELVYGKHVRVWVYVCDSDSYNQCDTRVDSYDSLRKMVVRNKLLGRQCHGHLYVESNGSMNFLSGKYFQVFGQNLNYLHNNLRVNLMYDDHNLGRNYHLHGMRNHRVCSHKNNNHLNARLDGRVSVAKYCHGLRPKSNILKQGPSLRSFYCSNSKKSDFTGNLIDERMSPLHSSFYSSREKSDPAVSLYGKSEFKDCQLVMENMKCQQDLLTGTPYNPHEVLYQNVCNELITFDQQKVNGIITNDLHSSKVLTMKCNNALIDKGVASSVRLLDNLSLSPKGVEPSALSLANSDLATSLLKPESRHLDLLHGKLSTGPKPDKSNVAPNATSMGKTETKEVIGGFSYDLAPRQLQTIKNSDLEHIKELGSGAYGTVYYGKWKGSDVAIKRIKPSCFTEGSLAKDRLVADFWKEAHILGQLHHPNIVAFYGVVTDGPANNLGTVTEYMVNGSLKQVLRRKDRTIDRRKRIILAMDAAFGMEYLHEKNIVHFDLKSPNLLVNMRDPQRPVCKIGDLGLSKIKKQTLVSGGVRGTIPWMAPELLNSNNKMVTEKVDVYSFGIVMWELLTGEEPYADLRTEEIIASIIKGMLRPEIPSWCDPAWRSLMENCWSSDPASRPAFQEIAMELRAMSAAMNIK